VEALAYIDAASMDPLVLALLIINRRALTIKPFITSASVEITLSSAVVAAKHLDLEGFIQGWKLASLSPEKVATTLTSHNKGWYAALIHFNNLLRGSSTDLQLEDSWKLAKACLPSGRALLKGLPFYLGNHVVHAPFNDPWILPQGADHSA
jgi:hypothetical protein